VPSSLGRFGDCRSGSFKASYPLHAQPAPLVQISDLEIHVSPHAFPLVQVLQHLDPPGDVASPQATAGPVAPASRRNTAIRASFPTAFATSIISS
jgi:hypothetical protein